MSERIQVVFLGTPAFAVPTLQALLASDAVEVLFVITQPDKPVGRGQKYAPTPVKALAQEAGLTVYQPTSLKKDDALLQTLRDAAPDFLVTVAFGQILSQAVLDIPRLGTVNVHASLLPELRGANPIQWAILQGKTETGITTMLTDIGVDTGAMLLRETLTIGPDETAGELAERLSQAGGPLLLETLQALHAETLQPEPQPHEHATHAPKLTKADALIQWDGDAVAIHNRIRAQQPWPGAVTAFQGERIKITRTRVATGDSEKNVKTGPPGTILGMIGSEGIQVATGEGCLEVLRLQPPGKREMSARDWANGALREVETPCFETLAPEPVA